MGSDESPIIYTYAGTGEGGYTGDGGPASDALMREPFMCAFDDAGNLYVCEATNHIVRRVDAQTGVITTIAGTGESGYSGDGGPATEATMYEPYSLAIDSDGSVYIVDRLNAVIRRVDAGGIITTVAGTGEPGYSGDGGPGIEAQMREPNDCFLDGKGGLLIADIQDQRIRRLDIATGVITTFAGNGEKTRAGDGLPATDAGILGARAVCMDGAGNTYIAEREGNGVRVVTPDGILEHRRGRERRAWLHRRRRASPGIHLGRSQGNQVRRRRQHHRHRHREPRHTPHRRRYPHSDHHSGRSTRRPRRRWPRNRRRHGPSPRLRDRPRRLHLRRRQQQPPRKGLQTQCIMAALIPCPCGASYSRNPLSLRAHKGR